MDKRLLLASRVAEPVTISIPDIKELLFNKEVRESWEPCWGSLTKQFLKFVAHLLQVRKLNLKANSIIKRSFISGHGRTGFKKTCSFKYVL